MAVMLDIRQLTRQVTNMMVIDKRDRSHGFFVLVPFLTHQVVANQITESLGPIRVSRRSICPSNTSNR